MPTTFRQYHFVHSVLVHCQHSISPLKFLTYSQETTRHMSHYTRYLTGSLLTSFLIEKNEYTLKMRNISKNGEMYPKNGKYPNFQLLQMTK